MPSCDTAAALAAQQQALRSRPSGVDRRGEGRRAEAALDGTTSYSVDTLLGRRGEPALDLAARRLAEELCAAGCRRCAHGAKRQALHCDMRCARTQSSSTGAGQCGLRRRP